MRLGYIPICPEIHQVRREKSAKVLHKVIRRLPRKPNAIEMIQSGKEHKTLIMQKFQEDFQEYFRKLK